jgi:hypothetical protein
VFPIVVWAVDAVVRRIRNGAVDYGAGRRQEPDDPLGLQI